MLKTAVNDGAEQLGLQQEITETSRVHTDVGTLLVLGVLGNVGLDGSGDGGNGLDDIIILIVVNEVVVVISHVYKRLGGWEKSVLQDENRTGQGGRGVQDVLVIRSFSRQERSGKALT